MAAMELWLEDASTGDDGGDVSWRFRAVGRGERAVRAGVRIGARRAVIAATNGCLHGDWTPALLAYAAAAARLALPDAETAWVTTGNVAAVQVEVDTAHRTHHPLFHSGSVEADRQFGEPEGCRR